MVEHTECSRVFIKNTATKDESLEKAIIAFRSVFFEKDFPYRTQKHVSNPGDNSAAKRINMYLRWMVRNDTAGVDFGIWKNISPSQLVVPLDLHVARVARRLHLLQRTPIDWQAALELTANLRILDKADPVKYDFALFGTGVMEKNR